MPPNSKNNVTKNLFFLHYSETEQIIPPYNLPPLSHCGLTPLSPFSVLLPKFPRSSSEREAGSYEEATTKAKRQVREINNLHISIFFMNIVTALYTQKNERRANYSKRITARK